ncbi:MAG: dihydroneopterin aldolase [Bacteroidia bacterium]
MIITIIALENIEKEALLGLYEIEKIEKNHFVINIKLHADITESFFSDEISDTINYAAVYKIIDKEFEKGGNLLEKKCYEIIKKVFEISEKILQIEVKIDKKKPQQMENCAASSVMVSMDKVTFLALKKQP